MPGWRHSCATAAAWSLFTSPAGRFRSGTDSRPGHRGHDPHGTFTVEIVDAEHPITRGLTDFETTDELYTCLAGNTPIHILATARSKVDQKDYPMAFVLTYGKGNVFHCVLGHDVQALDNPAVGELFRRGTAWTAGLSPVKEAK